MNISQPVKSLTFQKLISSRLTWVFSFSILTAVAAQIAIPVKPVPFTLQTMVVLLSGAFLGARYGALSQVIYLAMGIIGLPVFAQVPDGAAGFARLLGPTGGYLLAFPVVAFVVGHLMQIEKSFVMIITSMFLGEIMILLIGVLYLDIFFLKDFSNSLQVGAAIFTVWTIAKVFLAGSIYYGSIKSQQNQNEKKLKN
jgi:biotin transport system substrate-specific component